MNPVAQDKKRGGAQPAKTRDARGSQAPDGPRIVARGRVLLRLEAHRESLRAKLRRRVRMRRRYEDLWLIKMVTRIQREYLSQPSPGAELPGSRLGVEYGVADWAMPWGSTLLLQFQADLNVFDLQLESSRRWLSTATQRRAKARAAERFASITAGMAGELKAAGFTLPIWASGGLSSRRAASSTPASKPEAPRRSRRRARNGRVNLNQASFAELRSLKLSAMQTRRVLAYRRRIGGYKSIEQLDDIPGFPELVRERLKRRVSV
jgi:DNA uptake protein ComE-like DNA-binding protein